MVSVLFLIFSVILIPFVSFLLKVHSQRNVLKDIPGMSETPILGHAKHFKKLTPPEILQIVLGNFKKFGKVWKLFILNNTEVMVADPKIIEGILTSQNAFMSKSPMYKTIFSNWLGDSLFITTGQKYHSRRKIMTPSFHFKILDGFVQNFDKNATVLLEALDKRVGNGTFDIVPIVSLTAMDVICETSMGVSINAQKNSESKFVLASKELANIIYRRFFVPYLRSPLTYRFTETAKQEKKALEVIHGFCDSVIVSRRNQLLENSGESEENDVDHLGMKQKSALLDMLLKSTVDGKPLTNEEISDEVNTFMVAGHDTLTTGISFALYLLANHAEVQEKVLKEIQEVIGENEITLQILNQMPYLDAVIKETLRIFPPGPMIGREVTEETVLNGVKFPLGAHVILCIIAMHHDPEIYPDPEKFKPERFLGERVDAHPFAFVPFSAGPRNCIGQKFAMLEMKTMISRILRNFEICPDPEYKPILVSEIVLKSINGILIGLKKRS